MRKKILITIPRMPYPLNSGGRIAIYDALNALSKNYILTIVIIDDNKNNIIYIDEIKKISDNVYFFTKNRFRFILNSFFGLFYGRPLQVGYFYFKEYQKIIDDLSRTHDFFYSFMIRTSLYGVNLNLKKGHYAIDSMYLNYKKSMEESKSLLWKIIYKIEVPLLYKIEKNHVKKFDITSFVNNQEAIFWRRYGKVCTISHGIEDNLLTYSKYDDKFSDSIAFIGRMDYQPNIDAVLWFSNNVLPLLSKDIKFKIIGGFPTRDIINLQNNNPQVEILGFVDDPYIILRSCICTVAPMRTGGGLQTKVLTSMAVGSLVILSSNSAKAIENAENGLNLFIEDCAMNISKVINDIRNNPSKFKIIRENAKILIEKNYVLSVVNTKLINMIESQIN
jgi:hypothetical protein